ncbi:hypothetical protein Rhe02_81040 [Rhizocola hellebori]|uniref:Uncharacterized protein n=1 Tax=Rhizocola hellebori TaxID=1392758 RepID=A0A8J3QHB3_9ACTN|nr:hypothetical protein Rhe02_81040 [Rhizocola hellebori]
MLPHPNPHAQHVTAPPSGRAAAAAAPAGSKSTPEVVQRLVQPPVGCAAAGLAAAARCAAGAGLVGIAFAAPLLCTHTRTLIMEVRLWVQSKARSNPYPCQRFPLSIGRAEKIQHTNAGGVGAAPAARLRQQSEAEM